MAASVRFVDWLADALRLATIWGFDKFTGPLSSRASGSPRRRECARIGTGCARASASKVMFPPNRIVCLTEETVETLYLLGERDRIVGISGYVVRPPQARREKPRVSAFTSANIGKILTLDPDLVLTFSDLQADIAAAASRSMPSTSGASPAGCRCRRSAVKFTTL
jgi:hypothetical protein